MVDSFLRRPSLKLGGAGPTKQLCEPSVRRRIQVRAAAVVCAVLLVTLAVSCRSGGGRREPLTESEAIKLAVVLANEEAVRLYGLQEAPFDETSYTIEFRDERWHWGTLDESSPSGVSATVSFDSYGRESDVQVFVSSDQVTPMQ